MINKHLSRRNLLKLGTGIITAGVTLGVASNMFTPEPAIAQNNITPDEALRLLMNGNNRFSNNKRRYKNQFYYKLKN